MTAQSQGYWVRTVRDTIFQLMISLCFGIDQIALGATGRET